jgi:hypothetical protein
MLSQVKTKGAGVGVGEAVRVGETVGFGAGIGEATFTSIFTPLLHASFFPDLMHVYLKPKDVFTCPCLLQANPALTAANAGSESEETKKATRAIEAKAFLMAIRLLSHVGFVCPEVQFVWEKLRVSPTKSVLYTHNFEVNIADIVLQLSRSNRRVTRVVWRSPPIQERSSSQNSEK